MKSGMKMARVDAFRTSRLNLRLMTEEEWDEIVINVMFANEFLIMFANEKTEEFCEQIRKPSYERVIYYSIHHPETDELIGYVGYDTGISYIEYYIIEKYRNYGYAYEAVSRLIEMLFNGYLLGKPVRELHAWVVWNNNPSAQLLLKLGFHATGLRIFDNGMAGRFFTLGADTEEDIA